MVQSKKRSIVNLGMIFSISAMVLVLAAAGAVKHSNLPDKIVLQERLGGSFLICFIVLVVFLLIKFFKGLIVRVKSIAEHPFSGIVSALILVLIISSGTCGIITLILKPQTFSDDAGMLEGAFFSDKSESETVMITYTDKKGNERAAYAYPGEINIFVEKETELAAVVDVVERHSGKILSQIPEIGFYMVRVIKGSEAETIQKLLDENEIVLSAAPNLVVQGSMVDLSGTGKADPGDIVTALISTPDPNAKVIIAQLDNFVPLGNSSNVNSRNYGSFGSEDSHGYQVYNTIKSVVGEEPIMPVHVGGWPCDRMPSALCSSSERTVNALAATVAGAEINGQKVNINLSYNVVPKTTDPAEFATADDPRSNSWATSRWQGYEEQLYGVLRASDWAKGGNVVLNQSAGNGVNLVDEDGRVIDTKGMDLSNPIKDLKQKYPEVNSYVNFAGALDFDTGEIKPYSNFGTGVTYVKIKPGSPEGTSFAAPILTGVGYMGWDQNYEYGPDIINNAVRQFAVKTANSYKLDEVSKAWFYRYVENLEENQINANALEKRLDTTTQRLIEEQSKENFGTAPPVLAPLVPSGNGGLSPAPNINIDDMDVSDTQSNSPSWDQPQNFPEIVIPEPPDPWAVDLDNIDTTGGQTTDPCRWGGPGC